MYKFSKKERLRSKKQIEVIFSEGKKIIISPYKVLWKERKLDSEKDSNVKVLITVPKKHFKKAVTRNLIRRRIKEAYRLNKHILYQELIKTYKKIDIIIIYTKEKVLDFDEIEEGIINIFRTIN